MSWRWAGSGPSEFEFALKNTAMAGGALQVVSFGARSFILDARR
jgi:uncharacterized membrane protein YphA (DoxX/SURF4 family)